MTSRPRPYYTSLCRHGHGHAHGFFGMGLRAVAVAVGLVFFGMGLRAVAVAVAVGLVLNLVYPFSWHLPWCRKPQVQCGEAPHRKVWQQRLAAYSEHGQDLWPRPVSQGASRYTA